MNRQMNKIEIFCVDNNEFKEIDSIDRGYRGDIYVRFKDEYFNLNFYDITRLKQDFETEIEHYGVFSPDPNIIIVNKVNKNEIKKSIENLVKQKYFYEIKPLSAEKLKSLKLEVFG